MDCTTVRDYAPPTVEVIGTLEELTLLPPKGGFNHLDAFGKGTIHVSP